MDPIKKRKLKYIAVTIIFLSLIILVGIIILISKPPVNDIGSPISAPISTPTIVSEPVVTPVEVFTSGPIQLLNPSQYDVNHGPATLDPNGCDLAFGIDVYNLKNDTKSHLFVNLNLAERAAKFPDDVQNIINVIEGNKRPIINENVTADPAVTMPLQGTSAYCSGEAVVTGSPINISYSGTEKAIIIPVLNLGQYPETSVTAPGISFSPHIYGLRHGQVLDLTTFVPLSEIITQAEADTCKITSNGYPMFDYKCIANVLDTKSEKVKSISEELIKQYPLVK